MGTQMSSMNKVSFEDLQWFIKGNPNNYLLINTLDPSDQGCLVKETLPIAQEVETINKLQKKIPILLFMAEMPMMKVFQKNTHSFYH